MKIAICDDDALFLKKLKNKIYEYSNLHNLEPVVDSYTTGSKLIVSAVKYDIIFLDYKMEDIDGLETARRLRKGINRFSAIIFLTNCAEIAIDAYSVDTFRFVLKNTLWKGLFKALDDYQHQNTAKYLYVKSNKEHIAVAIDDIVFIDSQNRNSFIHLLENTVIETKTPLSLIFNNLPHTDFFKVHKSFIVNLRYIESRDYSSVKMAGCKQAIPVSRNCSSQFKMAHGNFIKEKNNM